MVARSEERTLVRVIELIRETLYLPIGEITSETNLKQDFGLDSLDILHAFLDLEAEFGFEFSHETMWTCKDLGEIACYIAGCVSGRAASARVVKLAA